MAERSAVETIEEAIRHLSLSRPELGLEAGGDLPSLAEIAQSDERLDRWLDDTATLAAGIDRRTAAA